MSYVKFGWGALLLAAALAMPAIASAQDKKDEGTDVGGDAEASGSVGEDVLGGSPLAASTEEAPPAEKAEPKAEEKAPEPAASSPVQGTWTKKIEFASEDGNFKFQPLGFIQPKLQLVIATDDKVDDKLAGSGFLFQRARFGFRSALFKFARLEMVGDFKTGDFGIVDAFADIDPWNGVFALRVGRFRPWFGRQFMASSTQLQMVENAQSWADKSFGLGLDRDYGVGVFGLIKDTFEYGLGVWNGDGGGLLDTKTHEIEGATKADGTPVTAPGNIDVMIGGRLAVHPLAPAGVGRALPLGNESDSDISDKPGLAVGVSAYYNKRHDRVAYDLDTAGTDALYYDQQFKLGADVGFQMIGLSVAGEFYLMKVWLPSDADPTVEQGVKDQAALGVTTMDNVGLGMYLQVGYFVLPKKLEIAARFDMVDPNKAVRGNRMYPGLGATYYFFGNNLKVQLMYRLDIGAGFEKTDPGHMPTGHDLFLMLQASI